ncbi:MAG: hypothetical protein ACRBCT_06710 [Alphaproteobacteria bacterium]
MHNAFDWKKQIEREQEIHKTQNYDTLITLQETIFHHAFARTKNKPKPRKKAATRLTAKTITFLKLLAITAHSIKNIFVYILKTNKNERIIHYMIQSRSAELYDTRSAPVLKVIPASKTLNLLHLNNINAAHANLKKIENVVYFEAFEKLIPSSQKRIITKKVLKWILKTLTPQRILMIDDARHTIWLRSFAKKKNIKTIFYMHGRFNEFHIGLFHAQPDTYLMWSHYFANLYKKELKKRNIPLTTQCIITGHPQIPPLKQTNRTQPQKPYNILLPLEDNINYSKIEPYLKQILQTKELNLIIKTKSRHTPDTITKIAPDTQIISSGSFLEACQAHNISCIIGTHSTALLESWLINIPSALIPYNIPYAQHIIKDELCHTVKSQNDLNITILKACQSTLEEINLFKEKIWSPPDITLTKALKKYV